MATRVGLLTKRPYELTNQYLFTLRSSITSPQRHRPQFIKQMQLLYTVRVILEYRWIKIAF